MSWKWKHSSESFCSLWISLPCFPPLTRRVKIVWCKTRISQTQTGAPASLHEIFLPGCILNSQGSITNISYFCKFLMYQYVPQFSNIYLHLERSFIPLCPEQTFLKYFFSFLFYSRLNIGLGQHRVKKLFFILLILLPGITCADVPLMMNFWSLPVQAIPQFSDSNEILFWMQILTMH